MARNENDEVVDALAAIAHQLWCHALRADGWRHGLRHDEDERTHPLLCEYADLPEQRRAALRAGIEHDEHVDRLRESADLTNSIAEWTLADLKVGLRVRYCDADCPDPMSQPTGRVLDWVVDGRAGGRIDSFRVRWDNGDICVYEAAATYIVPGE